MKRVGIIKKLSNVLLGNKSFVRSHLDYADLIYVQPVNESSCQQNESVQCNAFLEITVAIIWTSRLKLYKKIGLESLKFRRWLRCTFCKIKGTYFSSYLHELIPERSHMYNTRSLEHVAILYQWNWYLQLFVFATTISEWNTLVSKIRQSKTLLTFQNGLINIWRSFIQPIYNVHNSVGLKLLTRVRLGLSHLSQHKFNHHFQCRLKLLCSCSLAVESVSHFFLHWHYYSNIRSTTLNELETTDINLLNQEDDIVIDIRLYGSTKFNTNQNYWVLLCIIF